MDIFITLIQYATLISFLGVLLLVAGALPYHLGRLVGRMEANRDLSDLAVRNKLKFLLKVADLEVRGARNSLERLKKAGSQAG